MISYPEMRLPDGQARIGSRWVCSLLSDEQGKAQSFICYAFEQEYEIQPGQWIMGLAIGGEVLLEQRFTVDAKKTTSRR